MTEGLLALAATCAVSTLTTQLTATDTRWVEDTEVRITADRGCRSVEVWLDADTTFQPRRTRLRLSDDSRKKLPAERWRITEPGADGRRRAVLELPELLPGDRIWLDFTRTLPLQQPWRWQPGADGASFAELRYKRSDHVRYWGEVMQDRRGYWTSEPGESEVVLIRATPPHPPVPQNTNVHNLSAMEALQRAADLAWIPRGVDGATPVAGQAALQRGAADDRGYARTLVALTEASPDQVELGVWHVTADGPPLPGAPEAALWWTDGRATPLVHPDAPPMKGVIVSSSGSLAHEHRGPPTVTRPPEVLTVRTWSLHIPEGDPMLRLFPGGGSSLEVEEVLTFENHGRARVWSVPLPQDVHGLNVSSEPENIAVSWRQRPDDLVLLVPPTRHQTVVKLRYTLPDAPVAGEIVARPGERLSMEVRSPDGRVRRSDRWWWLESVRDQPVQPDRQSMIDAISWRYNHRSMPEPALPLHLKRQGPGWELAAQLRPTLGARVAVEHLPEDPSWPRPLLQARRSGVMTPIEAALVLRLYADQARMQGLWVLARPAELGPGHPVSPVGYTEGLTVVSWQGEERWIDVGCRVCAPFELRPHLEGASAWSALYDTTPPPTEGSLSVTEHNATTTWQLTGPPALLLRLWLEQVPVAERAHALTERLGGAGASLIETEGLELAGEPVRIVLHQSSRSSHTWTDPELRPDGSGWFSWIGTRTMPSAGPNTHTQTEWFDFERSAGIATLTVKQRSLPPAALEALHVARSALP